MGRDDPDISRYGLTVGAVVATSTLATRAPAAERRIVAELAGAVASEGAIVRARPEAGLNQPGLQRRDVALQILDLNLR
jgi:hypothetical protein